MQVDLDDNSEISLTQQRGLALVGEAELLTVNSQESYEQAAEFRRRLKANINRVREIFKPMKQAADNAHHAIVTQEKRILEGPEAAERTLRDAMDRFDADTRRERAMAEARAAEEAKMIQEVAKRDGVALPSVSVPVAPALPRAEGIVSVSRWKAVVTDKLALIKAVAAGALAESVLEVNMAALDEMARTQRAALNVPGVKAEEIRSSRASAR